MRFITLVSILTAALGAVALRPAGDPPAARADERIGAMLDDFHAAAAEADEERYFGHFTQAAVFLGTDPGERWPVREFRVWAKPHFQRDSAWTYHAVERHIDVAPCGKAGWFDEVVRNAKYGDLRGTGAVVLEGDRWKIAQYNLTFMIPNDDAQEILDLVRRRERP